MKIYPSQPDEIVSVDGRELAQFIIDFLKHELPDCSVNKWFVESVHLANMVDRLVEEINGE